MKRCICIGLIWVLCFGLFGCQKEIAQPEALPELASDAMEILYESGSVRGRIAMIHSPDVIELRLTTSDAIKKWGENVYIITANADRWCYGDVISVEFLQAYRPHDAQQYVRIVANNIFASDDSDMMYKPIIYLYPETEQMCSVKVTLDGELTCTYPQHGTNGWENFTAYPDGTLIFPDGKEYYALYWEGWQNTQWDFSEGFCVRGEDTAEFLEWALAEQGLTPREANEFIVYWLPLMQNNPYNVISFQTKAYTDGAVLEITPAPDSVLRVFMAYYPANTAVEITPQTFESFAREGFTVVEWGGSPVTP